MTKLFPALALALAVTLTPAPAAADTLTDDQLEAVAKRVEKDAKKFSKRFDKELDKSILNKTEFEQAIDKRGEKLKSALDGVHGSVKRGKFDKVRKRLDRALQIAHDVDQVMTERRFSRELESHWLDVRDDLNTLAVGYDLEPL